MKGITLLRDPIAALQRTRSLAYRFDMSRSLHPLRLALESLATISPAIFFNYLVRQEAPAATNKVSAMKWRWEAWQ
jgi:hypothetical protein